MPNMKCNHEGCPGTAEANPTLYVSLGDDGQWRIVGVEDNGAQVTCSEFGHDQNDRVLTKSLTAFLEEALPGCTWQGSKS